MLRARSLPSARGARRLRLRRHSAVLQKPGGERHCTLRHRLSTGSSALHSQRRQRCVWRRACDVHAASACTPANARPRVARVLPAWVRASSNIPLPCPALQGPSSSSQCLSLCCPSQPELCGWAARLDSAELLADFGNPKLWYQMAAALAHRPAGLELWRLLHSCSGQLASRRRRDAREHAAAVHGDMPLPLCLHRKPRGRQSQLHQGEPAQLAGGTAARGRLDTPERAATAQEPDAQAAGQSAFRGADDRLVLDCPLELPGCSWRRSVSLSTMRRGLNADEELQGQSQQVGPTEPWRRLAALVGDAAHSQTSAARVARAGPEARAPGPGSNRPAAVGAVCAAGGGAPLQQGPAGCQGTQAQPPPRSVGHSLVLAAQALRRRGLLGPHSGAGAAPRADGPLSSQEQQLLRAHADRGQGQPRWAQCVPPLQLPGAPSPAGASASSADGPGVAGPISLSSPGLP
jgi:hypothetical protein